MSLKSPVFLQSTPQLAGHQLGVDNRVEGDIPDTKQSLETFLKALSYTTPHMALNIQALRDAVILEVQSWNADDGKGGKIYQTIAIHSSDLIELAYYYHPFKAKVQLAIYTVCLIIVDDLATRMPSAVEDFQRRLVLGLPQLDPVLEQLPRIFERLYHYWDPVCANSIVAAALEFTSGTVLEGRREMTEMSIHSAALRWPSYLRDKTGVGPGYSCMIFTRDNHPDMSTFVQALADMDDYITITNDILSFYKEELASDEMTYAQIRSRLTGKHPRRVLNDMVQEAITLNSRVVAMLADHPAALASWKTFQDGYTAWHLSATRYRLSELGLSM